MSSPKKKKMRRSSLASRRITASLSPGIGLQRQVEQDLPSEERLQQLSALCLKSAVDKVSMEAESEDVKDQLENVKEELLTVLGSKEHRETVDTACRYPDKLLPNPANADMDETIQIMERRIERLQKEEQDWHDFYADLARLTQEAESKIQNLVLLPSGLSDEQKSLSNQYLPDLADLGVLKQQNDATLNRVFILACEHERNDHIQKQLQIKKNKQLDEALKKIHEKMFPNIGSPRASVLRLTEFPSPPADP